MMSKKKEHDREFPVRLTLAQRIVVAEVFPKLSERLRLDEPKRGSCHFDPELQTPSSEP
jgi:hypothetical protein